MSRYQTLIDKANLCRITAIKSNSKWAKDYWLNVAIKLEEMAANLPLTHAGIFHHE